MTEASSGYLSSHSSAASREAPHLRPTDVPEPRNAKILAPTLTTTSSSQGSSCQAPGLATQYASSSSHVIASSPDRRLRVERDGEPGDGSVYDPAGIPSKLITASGVKVARNAVQSWVRTASLNNRKCSPTRSVTSAILSTSRGPACRPRPVRPIISYRHTEASRRTRRPLRRAQHQLINKCRSAKKAK